MRVTSFPRKKQRYWRFHPLFLDTLCWAEWCAAIATNRLLTQFGARIVRAHTDNYKQFITLVNTELLDQCSRRVGLACAVGASIAVAGVAVELIQATVCSAVMSRSRLEFCSGAALMGGFANTNKANTMVKNKRTMSHKLNCLSPTELRNFKVMVPRNHSSTRGKNLTFGLNARFVLCRRLNRL
jgi:hypothetical protein